MKELPLLFSICDAVVHKNVHMYLYDLSWSASMVQLSNKVMSAREILAQFLHVAHTYLAGILQ